MPVVVGQCAMKKKIWVKKMTSFEEAEQFDLKYYRSQSARERLETVQMLREMYFKLKKGLKNEGRKGLRRSVKILQQA